MGTVLRSKISCEACDLFMDPMARIYSTLACDLPVRRPYVEAAAAGGSCYHTVVVKRLRGPGHFGWKASRLKLPAIHIVELIALGLLASASS